MAKRLPLSTALLLLLPALSAQDTAPKPEVALRYEVTVVRPNVGGDGGASLDAPWGTFKNLSLAQLVAYAYGVPNEQVTGGPAWVRTERFNLQGKLSETDQATLDKLKKRDQEEQHRLLLQALLADRFALTASRHPQEMNGYTLHVSPKGLRIHPSGQGPHPQGLPCGERGCALGAGDPESTIASLAELAASVLGKPVVDATGLQGTWDVALSVPLPAEGAEDLSTAMREAFEQQLGLRLQPGHVTADIVRIESVDHPSPN